MLRRKKSKVDEVKDTATELQEKATETLAPKISDARDAAGSVLDSVREEVPKLRDELAAAVAASAMVDSDDADDDCPKKKRKKGGKLKKLVLVAGIGGVAAFVAKKVKDSQGGAPVPPPAPRPTPAPEPAAPQRPAGGASETDSTPS